MGSEVTVMAEIWKKFLDLRPEVHSLRVLEYDNIYSSKVHSSNVHELLYVLDGRMTLHLGGKLQYHAVPGDFLIIPAATPHRDEFAVLKGLRILLIHFSWDAEEYFQQVNNRTLIHLNYDARCEAQRRLEFLRDRWKPGERGRLTASLELHALLFLFYFSLTQAEGQAGTAAPDAPAGEVMRRVKHYIDQNYSAGVTLKDAADFVRLSPSYLSRLFHREYGICFSAYLTARRLEYARQLLQNSDLQVGEIALRCGFGSGSYFIRVFSEHYGMTPKKHLALPRETVKK